MDLGILGGLWTEGGKCFVILGERLEWDFFDLEDNMFKFFDCLENLISC